MRFLARFTVVALLATLALAAAELQVPFWAPQGTTILPEDIKAAINNSPAPVLSVQQPTDDLVLLVVLDLTNDLAAVTQARNALTARIAEFPENAYVGVLHAQNGLNVMAEPTPDREVSAEAINSHPVGGRAGLLDTIEQVAKIGGSVMEKSGVRLAILYLTDSDVCGYRENFCNAQVNSNDSGDLSRGNAGNVLIREKIARMVNSLNETRAPVFISQLTYRNDNLNVSYQTGLIALAAATGGSATISRSNSQIPSAINETIDRILSSSSVTIELPNEDPGNVGVQLTHQGKLLDSRSEFMIKDN